MHKHTHTHTPMHIHMHTLTHTHTHTRTHTYTVVHTPAHKRMYTHAYTYTKEFAGDGSLQGAGVCRGRLKTIIIPPKARGKRPWEFAGDGRKQAIHVHTHTQKCTLMHTQAHARIYTHAYT